LWASPPCPYRRRSSAISEQDQQSCAKLLTHSERNGFLYTFERTNGQTLLAKPYQDTINWTKGIDQKTGLPVDYDPNKDIQHPVADSDTDRPHEEALPVA
jgi:glucose dehydrogenase